MKRFLALTLAAATLPPLFPAAPAQAQAYAAPRVDQLRAGRFLVMVFEGSPPGSSNAKNGLTRGIRVFEHPRKSTFAAVAAQEIFEFDLKSRGFVDMRQMEIISHEIESLVASRYGGFDLAAFEAKEAHALAGYARLRGMSEAEIAARMRAARPIAEQWLAQNRDVLRALLAYRFRR